MTVEPITEERIDAKDGDLPFGAAYMIASFFDDHGRPVDKGLATKTIVRCFSSNGRMLGETFADVDPDLTAVAAP